MTVGGGYLAGIGLLASLFINNIKIQKQARAKGTETKENVKKGKEDV
jgi:hypothetical protein